MINFDNTLSIKAFASSPEAQAILNTNTKGNEKQLYTIGQAVKTSATSTIRLDNAVITDFYMQNGYVYYTLSYTVKRKQYTYTARQKEIETIESRG